MTTRSDNQNGQCGQQINPNIAFLQRDWNIHNELQLPSQMIAMVLNDVHYCKPTHTCLLYNLLNWDENDTKLEEMKREREKMEG
jgi:hypothetical protein